jgi:hypothetical protein
VRIFPNGINTADLNRAEGLYREQLRARPEDMGIRLSLAWCLFMLALHRSGHESAFGNYALAYRQVPPADQESTPLTADRSADALLRECLQQTYTIKHLSVQEDERLEVARLQALVELAGAQALSIGAEEQSLQRLSNLAREAMLTFDGMG